jgi:hypothetical protein
MDWIQLADRYRLRSIVKNTIINFPVVKTQKFIDQLSDYQVHGGT